MNKQHASINYISLAMKIFVLLGLCLTQFYSYLLFHSLFEIFSIIIGCGIFMLAWNSRKLIENNYLLFLGITYLCIASIDLVHTLAYTGMGIFRGYNSNLPTQLWISARYIESLSLLIMPLYKAIIETGCMKPYALLFRNLKKSEEELRDALNKVKTLKGIIPICCRCKKIRNDKGYWQQVETYIEEHSDADFSHSLCWECAKELYPGLYKDKNTV